MNATPAILFRCSGSHMRLLSRLGFSKQFLCLTGAGSLFPQVAQRLSILGGQDIAVAKQLIVAKKDHRFLAADQLREAGIELRTALLEHIGRNTAQTLMLVVLAAQQQGQDLVLIVIPADHTVANTNAFTAAMQTAIRQVARGSLVFRGITPGRPETGHGYIQVDAAGAARELALAVPRFVVTPDSETTPQYLGESGYFWSAVMFVVKFSVRSNALWQCRSDIAQATQAAVEWRTNDGTFIRADESGFDAISCEFIEYAAMDKLASLESCLLNRASLKMALLAPDGLSQGDRALTTSESRRWRNGVASFSLSRTNHRLPYARNRMFWLRASRAQLSWRRGSQQALLQRHEHPDVVGEIAATVPHQPAGVFDYLRYPCYAAFLVSGSSRTVGRLGWWFQRSTLETIFADVWRWCRLDAYSDVRTSPP